MSAPAELIAQLSDTWSSTADLCATLSSQEWRVDTDCPGWDVRAQLGHVIGTESMLLGRPRPPMDGPYPDHVRNDIGKFNEHWLASLADLSDDELLAAFREVTASRRAALAALTPEDWEAEGGTPVGRAPYRRFMEIRVFDCWAHEQDIRTATGHPGHNSGPVVDRCIDEVAGALGYLVGERAQAPDGSSVRFEIGGDAGRTIDVAVDGRARVVDDLAGPPTVTLRTDPVTLVRLGGGRVTGPDCLARGSVTLAGDGTLGARVIGSLAFTI